MARNEQLIRQHKILQILERVRYGKTLEELRDDLVDELGLVSLHTRSVRRDLEALQAAGIDVDAHDSGRGRVWKLGPKAKGSYQITASATELIALSLGRDLMYPLAGTPFWIGIESFWNKIREEIPDTVLDHYQRCPVEVFSKASGDSEFLESRDSGTQAGGDRVPVPGKTTRFAKNRTACGRNLPVQRLHHCKRS